MPMTGRLTDSSWADESGRLSPRIKAGAGADWDRPSIAYKANSKIYFLNTPLSRQPEMQTLKKKMKGKEREQKKDGWEE